MQTTLARLEATLSRKRPAFFSGFRAGLSDDVLEKAPQSIRGVVHADLLALYRWRNGHPRDSLNGAFQNTMAFGSFEESLQAYSVLTQLQLAGDFEWHDWWTAGWFPVLHGPSGDHLCVDAVGAFGGAPGQIIDFVHDDASRSIVAPSLSAWLESYCDLLDADLLDDDGCLIASDEFVWVRGIHGFPSLRSASQK